MDYNGGGEAISNRFIVVGRELGYDIRVTSMRPFKLDCHFRPDLTILCDLTNHTAYPKKFKYFRYPAWLLRFMTLNHKVFYLSNAYTNLCNLSYLPCNGNASPSCPYSNKLCFALESYPLAIHNLVDTYIFLSPLHKRISDKIFTNNGIDKNTEDIIFKPFIDTSLFKLREIKKTISKLFVGVISEAKGAELYEKSTYRDQITYAGTNVSGIDLSGTVLGHVDYSKVALLMSQSEEFIFWPRWPEPQGRVVVEAALSGCRLNCNENVGATSFDFDISDPKNIDGNELKAWKEIRCLV